MSCQLCLGLAALAEIGFRNCMRTDQRVGWGQVREMEVRLELADAKLRQAELTAMEHLHTAQIEAANFKEASRLLNDMGDKYRQFETTMKETSEVTARVLPHFIGICWNLGGLLDSKEPSHHCRPSRRRRRTVESRRG